MKAITLGYKAFDLHELTCHFVARYAGIYAGNGLSVSLLDTRAIPDRELPHSVLSVACGAALMRWLGGEQVKVVFVAATKPMFWLYGRADIGSVGQLAGGRIAAYPPAAPPAHFLRMVLADAGLDAVDVTMLPAGEDAARLAMLRSGETVAALVGSTVLPRRAEASGFRRLLCLGDGLQVPTTGLAVSAALLAEDLEAVQAMQNSFAAALRLVHEDEALLREALGEADVIDERDLGHAGSLVREFYSADGRVCAAEILPGVQRFARSLGAALPAEIDDLYLCTVASGDAGGTPRPD